MLLTTYQIERAADNAQLQVSVGTVSIALIYMGAVAAVVSGDRAVPIGLLLVLPLPALGLLNLLIGNTLQWLARHYYIQKLERVITGQPGHIEPLKYQFPYWQRYVERILDPEAAAPAFRPLSILWPVMPLATFTVFITVLVVMAFQHADQLATYGLCAIVAAGYLGLFVLGIGTFVLGVRTLKTDFGVPLPRSEPSSDTSSRSLHSP
jgi:hypothetical protein